MAAMVKIRIAFPEDAPHLARLCREALGYDYPLPQLAEKLERAAADPDQRVFVAVNSAGAPVGFVHTQLYDVLYAPTMLNILGLAVDAACRRQGVGSALLAAAELDARRRGVTGMRLTSGQERTDAHRFYEKNGYRCAKAQLNLKKQL